MDQKKSMGTVLYESDRTVPIGFSPGAYNTTVQTRYIVQALMLLSRSEHAERCVFKGGTSLSKCYPGSIERFSEDIDLTYIPEVGMTNKQIERRLKVIEKAMTYGAETEIIPEERNDRNKSIWF